MHTSTRLGLDIADGTDAVSGYPAVDAQAKGILDNAALVTEGVLASRPAANTVEHNHVYHATDLGQWSIADGTNWNALNLACGSASSTTTLGVGTYTTVAAGITVNLPAPVANAVVVVQANNAASGASPVTVQYGSAIIYGPGLNGVSSFVLGMPMAAVGLISDGNFWRMMPGSMQDTGWVALTAGTYYSIATNAGFAPAVRLQGNTGRLRGCVKFNGGGSPVAPVQPLPTWARPSGTNQAGITFGCRSGNLTNPYGYVDYNGNVNLTGTPNSGEYIYLDSAIWDIS